jgi:hypothetical protein
VNAFEFIADLNGSDVLTIPHNVASQLPKSGRVRVVVLTDDAEDSDWRSASYEQFLRDHSPEDSVYDSMW